LEPEAYYGVDISKGMLERAKYKFPGYLFEEGDLINAEIPDKASCVISLYGSPCYSDIGKLIKKVKKIRCKVWLGLMGDNRNQSTYAAQSENGVLEPWRATKENLERICGELPINKVYKVDALYKYKGWMGLGMYVKSIELENWLPIRRERFSWILIEI
jgi:SAM-dependent methyltransferase